MTVDENNEGIVLDDAAQAPETPVEQKEPGWYKARFAHDLERERRKWEAEQEEKLAPIYQYMMDREANELVESGEFRSLDRAKEYLSLKKGQPVYQEIEEDEEQEDPVLMAKADFLARQAEKIKANRGLDVMELFNTDPDIQQKVLSGELDFYDLAEMNDRPLSPVRNSNGIGLKKMSIGTMSDEQFEQLQRSLAEGRAYDLRK